MSNFFKEFKIPEGWTKGDRLTIVNKSHGIRVVHQCYLNLAPGDYLRSGATANDEVMLIVPPEQSEDFRRWMCWWHQREGEFPFYVLNPPEGFPKFVQMSKLSDRRCLRVFNCHLGQLKDKGLHASDIAFLFNNSFDPTFLLEIEFIEVPK